MPNSLAQNDVVDAGRETRLLQQRLIDARFRLDRHVARLARLNRLSTQLLGSTDSIDIAPAFVEGVIEVLDLEVAAVWILGKDGRGIGFAAHGFEIDEETAKSYGKELLCISTTSSGLAMPLNEAQLARISGFNLGEALVSVSRATGDAGGAILLAGNTVKGMGVYEAVTEDLRATMASVGEMVAAFLNINGARQRINNSLLTLRESEERLALVLSGTNDGWWDWVISQDTCLYSVRWWMMLGESQPEQGVQQGFWLDRVFPEDREKFSEQLNWAFEGGAESIDTELRLMTASGSPIPVLVRGVIRRDGEGKPVRFAGSVQDLTERKRHEDDVHRLAYYDVLTELPNRRMLEQKLKEMLNSSKRTNHCVAVFILDIDRFKILNDTHGHAAGDALLREVARRLSDTSRPADFVARLGGDEFVVALPNLGEDIDAAMEQAERIGGRLLAALNVPYVLDVGVLHHSASIGVAVSHGDIDDVGAILKHADVALYQAKTEGRHRVCIFEPEMQARLVRRSSIEARLRQAYKDGVLMIHYQPQVNRDGVLIGAEALMRWSPVDGSPISPGEFIPIAEESGFVNELGRWALQEACERLIAWGDELPPDFRIAVNVSGVEFLHPNYIERVSKLLEQTGVSGRYIRLEITEDSVLSDLDTAAKRMWELRALGIEFSLDDFGTGYSSLAYLRRLPISEVKIDRSYVSRIFTDPHDAAIIRSIIALCSAFGMTVVAEGVETVQQRDQLVNFGCDRFQGYLFGPAVAAGAQPASLLGGVGVGR